MSHVPSSGIGGFIGLEPVAGMRDAGRASADAWHADAVGLSTGRAAFRLILETVRPARVHVPGYVCHVLFQPLRALGIPWRTYTVDATLSAEAAPAPGPDELLVAVDYFGVQQRAMLELAAAHGERLVIDATQAFYARRYPAAWSFNSARKFFGVPDGAYLYAPRPVEPPRARRTAASTRHLELRAAGDLERARGAFLEHEGGLDDRLLAMSETAESLLSRIDYGRAAERRRHNYARLHDALAGLNRLDLPATCDGVPHSYPLLAAGRPDPGLFHRRRIFVPTFWPELLDGAGPEADLAARLLPLPIDQRYDDTHMALVADTARELLTA